MKILIFGASGTTGKHLVKQALERGHQVTAFVRNPDKLPITHRQLTMVVGNVSNPETVRRAMVGQNAVLSAIGADNMFRFDQVIVDGMAGILKTMASGTVHRLIYLSALGVKETRTNAGFMIRNLAPTILRTEIKGHEMREALIQESALQWTIVRAPLLTSGPFTGEYRSGENLKSKTLITALSRLDVTDFMLKELETPRFVRKCASLMPC